MKFLKNLFWHSAMTPCPMTGGISVWTACIALSIAREMNKLTGLDRRALP
jgi:hypothetical protein